IEQCEPRHPAVREPRQRTEERAPVPRQEAGDAALRVEALEYPQVAFGVSLFGAAPADRKHIEQPAPSRSKLVELERALIGRRLRGHGLLSGDWGAERKGPTPGSPMSSWATSDGRRLIDADFADDGCHADS